MKSTEILICVGLICFVCLLTPYHSIQGLGLFILCICVGLGILAVPIDYKEWKKAKRIRKYTSLL